MRRVAPFSCAYLGAVSSASYFCSLSSSVTSLPVVNIRAIRTTAAPTPHSQGLDDRQKLPKMRQIAGGVPSSWQHARAKFQRKQFLDPTRPASRDHELVDERVKKMRSSRLNRRDDDDRDAADKKRRADDENNNAVTSEQAYYSSGPSSSQQQQQEYQQEEEDPPSMPLPRMPVAKAIPDSRLRIALVGAVNSGKSSIWNRLVSDFRLQHDDSTVASARVIRQFVKDAPGLTRDAVEGIGSLGGGVEKNRNHHHHHNNNGNSEQEMEEEEEEDSGCIFTIVDTPGVIDGQIVSETARAVRSCHAAIFVVACDGELSRDELVLAKFLNSIDRLPVVCVLSKCDLARHRLPQFQKAVTDALPPGAAGVPIPISTLTDVGFDTLARVIKPLSDIQQRVRTFRDWQTEDRALAGDEAALEEVRMRNTVDKPIRVAFIGRTNSGKSSLVNCILGKYRSRSRADTSITTRDSVETECVFQGKKLTLIDTAPMVRFAHRHDRDFLSELHNATLHTIKFADICVIVFDATEGHPSSYDMSMAHMCVDEGRPILFAANRWDQVMDPSATAEAIDFKLKRQMNEVRYAHAVVTSAMTKNNNLDHDDNQQQNNSSSTPPAVGLNLSLLLKEVLVLNENWNKKVRSRDLTRFWRTLEKSVNIPMKDTRVHRIVQSHARPPTFILRLQSKDVDNGELRGSFITMLKNALVEEFGFRGVPLRVLQEFKDKNPDIAQS